MLLLALSLPVCQPLFTTRQLSGHDAVEYFPRVVEFHENIRHGILLPRWAPDLSAGYGQPFFLFNPPLLYYIAKFWHLVGLDHVTALNATRIMIVLSSTVAMYFLGKLYFGSTGGILAAGAYVYAPYFHTDLYVRYALAEFLAFPFYPLTLFGLAGYVRSRSKLFLIVATVGWAAILFSHNPAALLFAPLLFAFILYNTWITKSWTVFWWQVGAVLLGLGMAACIWVPIFVEKDAVNVHRLLIGNLRYSNHFVHLKQLFSVAWGYGLSRAGEQDSMSFSLGWGHLTLSLAAWVLARRSPERVDQSWLTFFTGAVIALCALMLPITQSLWDRIILLQYVQFPWRLLAPTTVCLALLVAPLGVLINETLKWRWPWVILALALAVLPNLSHARPQHFYEINFNAFNPEDFARLGVAVTTREEYEPTWVAERAPYRSEKIEIITGDVQVFKMNRRPGHLSANVAAREPSLIELGISYFPGWRVWIDGQEVDTKIASRTGLIRLVAPSGEHRIDAQFTRTIPRWIGEGLSILTTLMIFYLVWCWWPENVRDGLPSALKRSFAPQKSRPSRKRPIKKR